MIYCYFCKSDISAFRTNHPAVVTYKCKNCDIMQEKGGGVLWHSFELQGKYYWIGAFVSENSTNAHCTNKSKYLWFKDQGVKYNEMTHTHEGRQVLEIKFHPLNFDKIKKYFKFANFN